MQTFRHQLFRRIHCWLALPFALFLILQGLTGAAITWKHELDVRLNRELMQVPISDQIEFSTNKRLPISVLLEDLVRTENGISPSMLELPEKRNEAFIAWYKSSQSKGDQSEKKTTRQVMINPYTGVVMGERITGETGFSPTQLMPSLVSLHRQLLSGDNGKLLVSINGIVLLILALSGIYLWWPVWKLKAWRQAITISHQGSWKRFNFSLHRAAGFYTAPFFLIIATTGIYFNHSEWITPFFSPWLPTTVIVKNTHDAADKNIDQRTTKNLNLEQVISLAQQQFPLARVSRIKLPETVNGKYEIRLHQPGELREGSGATRVTIDAEDGKIIKVSDPLKGTPENRFYSYFFPLHSGEIFGVTSKIVVTIVGLLPLLFAISGTLIWWRRR